jgi:hypothetical protein
MEIQEIKCHDEYYDDELMDALNQLERNKKECLFLIDNCLWIYANKIQNMSINKVSQRFKTLLIEREPYLKTQLEMQMSTMDDGKITTINEGLFYPLSRPIILRNISPRYIGEIIFGDLMFRVQLYFDWHKFAELLNKIGIEFSWSSIKQVRREIAKPWHLRTSVIINGRMPQLRWNDVTLNITGYNLIRILFDGIRPQTLANQFIESLSIIKEKFN